jgi:hypothetical protein
MYYYRFSNPLSFSTQHYLFSFFRRTGTGLDQLRVSADHSSGNSGRGILVGFNDAHHLKPCAKKHNVGRKPDGTPVALVYAKPKYRTTSGDKSEQILDSAGIECMLCAFLRSEIGTATNRPKAGPRDRSGDLRNIVLNNDRRYRCIEAVLALGVRCMGASCSGKAYDAQVNEILCLPQIYRFTASTIVLLTFYYHIASTIVLLTFYYHFTASSIFLHLLSFYCIYYCFTKHRRSESSLRKAVLMKLAPSSMHTSTETLRAATCRESERRTASETPASLTRISAR